MKNMKLKEFINSDSRLKDLLELEPYTMGRFVREYVLPALDCTLENVGLLDVHPHCSEEEDFTGVDRFFPEGVAIARCGIRGFELSDDGLDMPLVCYQVGYVWKVVAENAPFVAVRFASGEVLCFGNRKNYEPYESKDDRS